MNAFGQHFHTQCLTRNNELTYSSVNLKLTFLKFTFHITQAIHLLCALFLSFAFNLVALFARNPRVSPLSTWVFCTRTPTSAKAVLAFGLHSFTSLHLTCSFYPHFLCFLVEVETVVAMQQLHVPCPLYVLRIRKSALKKLLVQW